MKTHILALKKLGACSDAVAFADKYDSTQAAWDACPRGDWLLWLLGRLAGPVDSDSRKKLVGVCAEIAELVLPIFEKRRPNDKRVRECIETCKRYAIGQATIDEVRTARSAAAAAYDAAYAAAADAAAAYAAAAATTIASADADAAAAYAAYAAYAAAAYSAADAAKTKLKTDILNYAIKVLVSK